MLTTIHLHGAAKARFGGPFRLDIRDAAEAVRALSRLKGFLDFVRASEWRVITGGLKRGLELDEETLRLSVGKVRELHFIPLPVGSKSGGGIGKILIGVALVAASFATAGVLSPALFSFGLSVGLAGVSSMIAGTPNVENHNNRDEKKVSALFNGAVNLTEPGNPYPLAYGLKVRTGSIVLSAGLGIEQLK